jgi:hypothetical protein
MVFYHVYTLYSPPLRRTGACENGWLVINLPACVPDLHSRLKRKEDNSKHTSNSLEREGDSHSRLKQKENNSKHLSNSLEGEGDNSHSRKKTGKLLLGPERRQRLREERHEVIIQQGHLLQVFRKQHDLRTMLCDRQYSDV